MAQGIKPLPGERSCERIGLRLPAETVDEIVKMAIALEIKRSDVIKLIINEYFCFSDENYKKLYSTSDLEQMMIAREKVRTKLLAEKEENVSNP
jgi:hypothetical protein